ncbi:MAG: N4-gp56 family major capsid protein [Syntrophobacteraceae bacterium]
MADAVTLYGDISPRTAGFAWKDLLKRALPGIVTEFSAQTKPVPKGVSKVVKFRRYLALARVTAPLAEGVTPEGKKLTYEDLSVVLEQWGDYTILTDVVEDTHEDPVFSEARIILAEQIRETKEVLNINVIKNGTNVYYANGTLRTHVNTPITRGLIRKAIRALKRQNAKHFTQALSASPNYGTAPIEAAFLGYCHTDVEADLRNVAGFKTVAEYSKPGAAFEYEIGAVEGVRFVATTLFEPWADGGGAKGAMLSTTGVNADVYPIIIVGKDFWAVCPLRGASSGMPTVVNPKPSGGDPLGQRGFAGWKMWHAGLILNETFGIRLEVAVTADPN